MAQGQTLSSSVNLPVDTIVAEAVRADVGEVRQAVIL
jgi:hypothetical protein